MAEVFEGLDGSSIAVSSFGGHLLSWKNKDGIERLFLSKLAIFDNKTAIRGGVPICFPKFGNFGQDDSLQALSSHGFLRQANWNILSSAQNNDSMEVKLSYGHNLQSNHFDKYPYEFIATLTIIFNNDTLTMGLQIQNTGSSAMVYTLGFHPYFTFDVNTDSLLNLVGSEAKNPVQESIIIKQDDFKITQETNLVFKSIRALPICATKNYSLEFTSHNLADIVIWNPYTNNSIKDLEETSYKQFVCIEPVSLNDYKLEPKQNAQYGFSVSVKKYRLNI